MSSVKRFAGLQAYIHTALPRINTVIRRHLDSNIWLIKQISEYLIASGGKRLRPIIHLLSAQACAQEKTIDNQDDIYTLSAVLELIHTATLLHDDVVDHSALRRGKATANATFGNAASVLSGDFLYSRAFQMMVSLQRLPVMDILSSATNIIAEGEVLQLLYAGEARISETQYRGMIKSKTAKLFEAAAELGAVLANCPQHQHALAAYGQHVGMAFQLIDDLLDYNSNADTLGKNTGDDLEEGKWTLPLLIAFERSDASDQARLEAIVQAKNRAGLDALSAIFEHTQALEETEKAAQQEAHHAIAALEPIPPSQYKDLLIELAQFAVYRNA